MPEGTRYQMVVWLHELYHHPERPPARQRDVLTCLAVHFMNWETGTGWASIKELARFARASRSTVQRALRWGRGMLLVVRVVRGHRLGNGDAIASEWRLEIPASSLRTVTPGPASRRPRGFSFGSSRRQCPSC